MGESENGEHDRMRAGANCAKVQWGMPSNVGRPERGWAMDVGAKGGSVGEM